ncbi:hypothetical protein A2U01_0102758, partial [Trifolium medium]|nr:hypothetical protein [Trifolium medium]
MNPSNPEFDRE